MHGVVWRSAGIVATLALLAADVRADFLIGLTTGNRIVAFDSTSPGTLNSNVAITGLEPGEFLLTLDRRPADAVLYGVGSSNRLYRVNRQTGIATAVGSPGAFALNGTAFGFDLDPVADRLRVTSDLDQNLQLNPSNATLTATDATLAYALGDPNFGANPNIVGLAYTNNVVGAGATMLYGIDSTLDILVTLDPASAGTLHTVGSLGFDTSSHVGFEISGTTGTAFLSLTEEPAGNISRLYTVNLNTGATTFLGNILAGAPLRGMAGPIGVAVPEPSSLVLVGIAGLGLVYVIRRKRQG